DRFHGRVALANLRLVEELRAELAVRLGRVRQLELQVDLVGQLLPQLERRAARVSAAAARGRDAAREAVAHGAGRAPRGDVFAQQLLGVGQLRLQRRALRLVPAGVLDERYVGRGDAAVMAGVAGDDDAAGVVGVVDRAGEADHPASGFL